MFLVKYQLPKMGITKNGEQQRMRMSKMQKRLDNKKEEEVKKEKQNKTNKQNGNNKRKNRKTGRRWFKRTLDRDVHKNIE